MMFKIVQVALQESQQPEYLGTKSKFWYRDDKGRRILFKADTRNCGEDWSEKVVCHLCKLLGLPHVHYEMAQYCDDSGNQQTGVICESFTQDTKTVRQELFLGNSLLFAIDPSYPKDAEKKYQARQHTVDAVSKVVNSQMFVPKVDEESSASTLCFALDYFVGYVLLDAWIANQDRHHENWGGVFALESMPNNISGQRVPILRLAPTFDHAAGLIRNISDDDRKRRLETKDKNYQLEAYALKARSAFYENDSDKKPMLTFDAFWAFAERAKPAARFWLKRLETVDETAIQEILDQVPESRMSAIAKTFTLKLLEINQKHLLEKVI